jgi:hypothetical protein
VDEQPLSQLIKSPKRYVVDSALVATALRMDTAAVTEISLDAFSTRS